MKKFIIVVLAVLLFVGILLPMKSSAVVYIPQEQHEAEGLYKLSDFQGVFDWNPSEQEVVFQFDFIALGR